jgi:hypothetical protein
MRYCGQLDEQRFDREVAPRCAPRYIGQEQEVFTQADLVKGQPRITGGVMGVVSRPSPEPAK